MNRRSLLTSLLAAPAAAWAAVRKSHSRHVAFPQMPSKTALPTPPPPSSRYWTTFWATISYTYIDKDGLPHPVYNEPYPIHAFWVPDTQNPGRVRAWAEPPDPKEQK